MTVAAALGVIDFRRARLLDPDWWRHCRALLSALRARLDAEGLRDTLSYALALVGNGGLKPESFEESQKAARACLDGLRSLARPWQDEADRKDKEEVISDLVEAYKKLVGDPATPEFREREAAALRALEERREKERQADEAKRRFEAKFAGRRSGGR